jgi:hypothetical protein
MKTFLQNDFNAFGVRHSPGFVSIPFAFPAFPRANPLSKRHLHGRLLMLNFHVNVQRIQNGI